MKDKKAQSTLNFKKAIDVAQANNLREAFLKFKNDSSFGIPEMEAVMTEVLGDMAARNRKKESKEWQDYWVELQSWIEDCEGPEPVVRPFPIISRVVTRHDASC
jgi:hypothetical protein